MMAKHTFSIGQAFASRKAESPQDYLDAALQAEKFIRQNAHETDEGLYWQLPGGGELDQTFYSGSAGVLYFYLKLAETTGDTAFRAVAERGTAYLAAHWRDLLTATPVLGLGTEKGLHWGPAGLGLVLGEAYRVLGREDARQAAIAIGQYYRDTAITDETGTKWTESTALALDGGIILYLLQLYDLFGDQADLEWIVSAGRKYLARGRHRIGGGLEFNGCESLFPFQFSMPNFEFGTSGSGYLLTRLYELTGDERYLEGAKAAAFYLKKISVRQKRGYLIPHDIYAPTSTPPVFYLSTCHGPAGTAKLFYQLYRLTGDESYYEDIIQLVDGLEALGAPEIQSAGLWNNVCLCCGQAGLVQFFVGLYRGDRQERWRELAVRSASVLLGERETLEDGSANWPMAWERVKPEAVTVRLGYYDGVAGVASALLQIYLNETEAFQWHRLQDDPFPEN